MATMTKIPAKSKFTTVHVQFEVIPPPAKGEKTQIAAVASQEFAGRWIDSDVFYGDTHEEAERAARSGLRAECRRVFRASAWSRAS